ncbi:PilT/PilU family type 4a pilus ATPase [Candidatus Peregrinibacteria bacterium]|nr:PilT/PilU family type 4a pilus ATPase [Candidatus Peregrinibacteria bacterium]
MNFEFTKILELAINRKASDIHFQTGHLPVLRIDGRLVQVDDVAPFQLMEGTPEFQEYMNPEQFAFYEKNGNTDFAFGYSEDYRFRGNVYRQQGGISMSLRLIRNRILDFDQLGLPPVFRQMAEDYRQGFFLVVGPTGQGKSTSLAAILNHINHTQEQHIITIEDPIEYIVKNDKSIIEQREVGTHASSFQDALRSSLRQDPDVIIIGEMRDYETIQTAITLAETGHLVFSTLHTNNSAQTIDRIIDTFPEHKQKQVRIQLASTLTGVVSQRLVPGVDGKLIFAYEQLLVTDAVRNIIRSEKSEQIYNALQTGEGSGMVRLEQCLAQMVREKKITKETAMGFAVNRELIDVFLNY